MEKCALIEERLLVPPISPAHFSQLDLLIMASYWFTKVLFEGHHVYKDIWTPMIEILKVHREPENEHDHRAVCLLKSDTIVGHVSRKLFLVLSGTWWKNLL